MQEIRAIANAILSANPQANLTGSSQSKPPDQVVLNYLETQYRQQRKTESTLESFIKRLQNIEMLLLQSVLSAEQHKVSPFSHFDIPLIPDGLDLQVKISSAATISSAAKISSAWQCGEHPILLKCSKRPNFYQSSLILFVQ